MLDRDGRDLAPLAAEQGVALLPLAGKPLVVHALEELARLGLREVMVVAAGHARQIAGALGDGERWGLRLQYFPGRGSEHPAAAAARLGAVPAAPLLVVRGDAVVCGIGRFLAAAASVDGSLVMARDRGQSVGLCLCREPAALAGVPWPFAPPPAAAGNYPAVEVEGLRYAALASLAEFHAASLEVAAGLFPGLRAPGWERRPGVLVGPGSFAKSPSLRGDTCVIGRNCRIHEGAELRGRVVVGDNCFVDRGAHLEDSVILPGTYIGENLDVRNALVSANWLLRVDRGSAAYAVADPFMLASMHTGELKRRARSLANRALGLLLLLGTAPLWPPALLLALLRHRDGGLLRSAVYRSNKAARAAGDAPARTFTAWEWTVSPPALRWLPWLAAVAAGHLNVLGACPRPAGLAEEDHWELLAGALPAGLLGPGQLELPPDAPPGERALNDLQFAHDRSLRHDLRYLAKALRALFSPRAWRGDPGHG